MTVSVTGTVERKKGFGPSTWALKGDDGKTYELQKAPQDLRQDGLKVKVEGEIKKDVMTLAMIGEVLEVQSFEPISP